MTAPLDLEGPHWRFSVSVYGRPGVADACILLQDRHGIDVNVLLVALIHTAMAGPPSAAVVARFEQMAAPWRQTVIIPLRAIRRALKEGAAGSSFGVAGEAVRRQVAATEIVAEQVEQAMLARLLPPPRLRLPAPDDLARTLERVITFYAKDTKLADDAEQAVATIVEAALDVSAETAGERR